MPDVLNTLQLAHQQLKDLAIASLQSDQEIDQTILDTLRALYALIQAVKVSSGV